MSKQIITVWYRWNNKNKAFEFNHYKEGYNKTQIVPVSDIPKQQKDFKNAKWRKKFGHLVKRGDKISKIEEEDDKSDVE